MSRPQLKVESRTDTGKGPARRLRATGAVPAIVYGQSASTLGLAVNHRELERVLDSNQLIDLVGLAQVEGKPVLLKEFQRDPVSQRVVHCDFYAVDTSKPVQISVPLRLTGKPAGLEKGGQLEALLRQLTVSCPPLSIPTVIEVDTSHLGLNDVLHAASVKLPEGVTLATDPNASIAHVVAPRQEATPAAAAAEGDAAAAAPAAAAKPDAGKKA